jgi:hypothetical protein
MDRLKLEIGEHSEHLCACCGGTTIKAWGYVYSHNDAHAVYYVAWTDKHSGHRLSFILSIGGWSEGADAAEKQALALECQVVENVPAFMIIDATASQLYDPYLGAALNREQAMSSSIKQEAFEITDEVIENDARVKAAIQTATRAK